MDYVGRRATSKPQQPPHTSLGTMVPHPRCPSQFQQHCKMRSVWLMRKEPNSDRARDTFQYPQHIQEKDLDIEDQETYDNYSDMGILRGTSAMNFHLADEGIQIELIAEIDILQSSPKTSISTIQIQFCALKPNNMGKDHHALQETVSATRVAHRAHKSRSIHIVYFGPKEIAMVMRRTIPDLLRVSAQGQILDGRGVPNQVVVCILQV
ncbi:hypothetical protein BU23DRAFT_90509 [Bimuria novae-zelandiae CBS 107.79]|uniref:Uncharacterized protein n=1 Tax=Bimuria novae-zelandiae CBS 107.79 TaxID=1447943 RepID=A0A6A5VEF5_9PLEO|nr:hypothetical protein BU23DRAFT_90509 [Bimuria novae-zelandiae CBS 107.79]